MTERGSPTSLTSPSPTSAASASPASCSTTLSSPSELLHYTGFRPLTAHRIFCPSATSIEPYAQPVFPILSGRPGCSETCQITNTRSYQRHVVARCVTFIAQPPVPDPRFAGPLANLRQQLMWTPGEHLIGGARSLPRRNIAETSSSYTASSALNTLTKPPSTVLQVENGRAPLDSRYARRSISVIARILQASKTGHTTASLPQGQQ